MKSTYTNARELFTAVLDLESDEKRHALLDRVATRSPELVAGVRQLLRAHDAAVEGEFFAVNPRRQNQGGAVETNDGELGSLVGAYRILEKIGEGGMGVVYMAEQEEPVRRKVAVKIIKLGMDTKQVVARFEAERQALAMMENPHIAKLLDAGVTQDGRPYFVMELVRGVAITNFCDGNRLSIKERLELFVPVCHAIQHAHQKGVIHRDIKPTNILVSQSGGKPHPMVIDFGVAKATNQRLTEKTLFTHFAQMVGTPSYMSPEQAEMSIHDVDTRSDVYSLGILLYELLTGTTPFPEERLRSASYSEIQRILKEEEPLRPSTMVSQPDRERQSTFTNRQTEASVLESYLRGDLDWIVLKAIDKDRVRRYSTPNELADDVTRHLSDEPVTARPPTFLYQLQKGWRRNRVIFSAAGMVVAILLAGFAVSLWMAWVANQARRDAEDAGARETALREETQENALKQRLVSYSLDMQGAANFLKENNLEQVHRLLDRYRDLGGIRGIYWDHLARASGYLADETSHQRPALKTLPHESIVRSISVSADGSRLASQTMTGKVRLFDIGRLDDVDKFEKLPPLQEFGGGVMSYGAKDGSVALSPDGQWLASDQQGTLKVWDAENGELAFERIRVSAPICFSPDSTTLLANSAEGLTLWKVADWSSRSLPGTEVRADVPLPCAPVFTPCGKRLILSPGPFASRLLVYNVTGDVFEDPLADLDSPNTIATDGTLVAAGGKDGRVWVWNLETREHVANFQAHTSIVLGLAFSPDGKKLATAGNGRAIYVWSTDFFERIEILEEHQNQVWNLKSCGDRFILASASTDHSVKLWNWNGPKPSNPVDAGPTLESGAASDAVGSTPGQRPPKTLTLESGDDIQAILDGAVPGDTIQLAAAIYEVMHTIVVKKPLTIQGVEAGNAKEPMPTILRGAAGLPLVIRIESGGGAGKAVLRNVQIENQANGIQHISGDFELVDSRVTIRTALDFHSVVSLNAKGYTDGTADTVRVDGCVLVAEDSGRTPEGTPPDVDVILAESGAMYQLIIVTHSYITNGVPNSIANGIETRQTRAALRIEGAVLHCQGMAIVPFDHRGSIDIRDNRIWSATRGISTSIDTEEPSAITGNHIKVEKGGLEVYPLFLQNYIAKRNSHCIAIGTASAGVTAGFFHKEFINRGVNFRIENNVLEGNPEIGVSLADSPEPENFGPPTPNFSHDNTIMGNDFSGLDAKRDIALGKSTYDNLVYRNKGLKTVFREAGKKDRNRIVLGPEKTWRFELGEITSAALEGNLLGDSARRSFWVWLPPSYDTSPKPRYPVTYVLHGFTGSHHAFKTGAMINVRIGELAAGLVADGQMRECILVLVDASNSYGGSMFGSNAVTGDYITYIGSDLVNHIDTNYRTLPDRDHRTIAGHSMGANGAFMLAMAYPEVFGAIAAMEPSADSAAKPTTLDTFLAGNPTLAEPTWARHPAGLAKLFQPPQNVMLNLLYGQAAALSPNPDKPPYFVDLPVRYPEREIVPEVWQRWLDQDLVSQIERDGEKLRDIKLFVDIGIGPKGHMEEGHDISYLRDALQMEELHCTFVESPGDHVSHLRPRTTEVLKFLSDPDAYTAPRPPSP